MGWFGGIIEGFFDGFINNPLKYIAQIAGSFFGIPPYVTAGAITAIQGGSLLDIAKSAAMSYASTELMSATPSSQWAADIKNYTINSWVGDFTDSIMQNFNLAPDQAVQLAKLSSNVLNSTITGGIKAALTGGSIEEGISSGITSGLVKFSADSFFDSVNQDANWGLSQQALNLMKGSTSAALNAFISGKGDPVEAAGAYISNAALSLAGSAFSKGIKDVSKLLSTDTDAAKTAQDNVINLKAELDNKIAIGENLRTEILNESENYQKTINERFLPFKTQQDDLIAQNATAVEDFNTNKQIYDENRAIYLNYDNEMRNRGYFISYGDDYDNNAKLVGATLERDDEGNLRFIPDGSVLDSEGNPSYKFVYDPPPTRESFLTAANNAATAANAAYERYTATKDAAQGLYDNNKSMIDGLAEARTRIETKVADLQKIRDDVEKPNAEGTNLAARVTAASNDYQAKYDAWAKTKEASERYAENYTKALAEAATRNATIDAINAGEIKATGKDADGNWTLSNGMLLTPQGKFMKDGQQAFTNAAGIPQSVLDFKASDGSEISFDENAGRRMSTSDVKTVLKRDYNIDATDAEADKFVGTNYGTTDANAMNTFANEKVRQAYFTIARQQPTDAQVTDIRRSGDPLTAAKDMAINGLDLPDDYKFPDTSTKVSFGEAYAAARIAYGPGATFSWTNPATGVTGLYTTENREEKITRLDRAASEAGKYDNQIVSYTKYRLLDNLSNPEFNPADLTKGEMVKFVDAYSSASPIQRAAMLKGVDSPTYKVIDTLLAENARYNPSGAAYTPSFSSASETLAYNPTGVNRVLDSIKTGSKVFDAATRIAVGDVAGVVTRGAQLLRSSIGLDNETADKIQQFWSDSKDKPLRRLETDDQRVFAGGMASGLESVGGLLLGGTMGSLFTIGAITANNAYQEGLTTWIDSNGRAYASREDAVSVGKGGDIRQLTPEENMMRTAVMTSLEIAGEAAGLPGMARLLKSIPMTGSAGGIVNAVKNAAVVFGNEQVSEFLTTTAQMAADKWLNFGLGRSATLDDYTKAIQDTALATTAAVGTAGSIRTAISNMQNIKNYSNPFSTNTGLDSVDPTVPSIKEAAANLGISESDISNIQSNVTNSVRSGNSNINSAQNNISESLQSNGMSTVKADAVASALVDKFETIAVQDFLEANGIDREKIPALTPLIQSQLDVNIDTSTAAKNIASIFVSAGMDPTLAGQTVSQFYSNNVTAPQITQADIDISNQLLMNAGINVGSAYKSTTGTSYTPTSSGATITNDQVQNTFGTTGLTTETGSTTQNTSTAGTTSPVETTSTTGTTSTAGTTIPVETTSTTGTTGTTGTDSTSSTLTSAGSSSSGATDVTNTTGVSNQSAGTTSGTTDSATTAGSTTGSTDTTGSTSMTGYTANSVTQETFDRAISNLSAEQQQAYNSLSQAQKDIIASQYQQGVDLNTSISNVQQSVADVETRLTQRINELVNQGLSQNQAIQQAIQETQGQITANNAQVNQRINELVNQGMTNQQATDTAIRETQEQITNLSSSVNSRINELVSQGLNYQEATQQAIKETQGQVSNLSNQVNTRINELVQQGLNYQQATEQAIRETQGQVTNLSNQVNTRINELTQQGLSYQQATQQAIREVQGQVTQTKQDLGGQITQTREDLTTKISDTQGQINARVDELMRQGQDFQTATNTAINEVKAQQNAAAEAVRAKEAQAKTESNLAKAIALTSPPTTGSEEVTPFRKIGLKTTGGAKFEGPLEQYLKMVKGTNYAQKPAEAQQQTQQQAQQGANVQQDLLTPQPGQTQPGSDYFSYGQQTDIDRMLAGTQSPEMGILQSKAGGLATPLMAVGGTARYGRYAGGGLNIVEHSGKRRLDFRRGDAVTGPGDGQSDDIPAMLADGEFVFPADVVAALGNGSTKAGSDKLYDMMHSIRAYHRSADPQDLPPPAKRSPLDYLKTRKARR